MNRAIVRLDEGTVNYIIGAYFMEHLPEEITNSDKFRMEVMRYKNKDARVVIKTDAMSTITTLINATKAEAANH